MDKKNEITFTYTISKDMQISHSFESSKIVLETLDNSFIIENFKEAQQIANWLIFIIKENDGRNSPEAILKKITN